MAPPDLTTEIPTLPWHPVTNPDCTNCNGLSRPVRRKKPCNCPLIQLALEPVAATRRHVQRLPKQAGLPPDLFVIRVLGVTPKAFWDKVANGRLSKTAAQHLNSIESVSREGSKVHVIYDVGNVSGRWDATLARRKIRDASPDHVLHAEVALMARQLAKQCLQHIVAPKRHERRRRKRAQRIL